MFWLAIKTLFYEKGRLFITLMGITFSTILTIVQVSMYLGMMGNATAIIRHIDADIWIASRNIQNFDFANPFPEERINRVNALPQISWTERLVLTWGFLKLAGGGQEQVQIVGYNPDTAVGAPWSMLAGEPFDVKGGRYMIIDKTSEQRLGGLEIGTIWELNANRFKLAGLSQGIKSFTTSPMIFMSYNNAQSFYPPGNTSFIVAKVKEKEKIGDAVRILKASMKDNDVYTTREFVYKSVMYWTVTTGMGMGFFLTAILGLTVGGAIVGQTIYANTMEHLHEFGTLKAVGARNIDLYKIIFSQAGINAVIGYAVGALFILLVKDGVEKAGVTLYLSAGLFLSLFFIILLICLLSAYFSVRKVRKLDPAMVFRV
ncbi:MAG: FtsX-like permease family protein [Deltaproteobacteria bacterium]|nr:FtsX-like permease family protein [Deltaproteobacteria bacterium]